MNSLQKAILELDEEKVISEVKRRLESGSDPAEIIRDDIMPAMNMVGEKFEQNEIFLTGLMMCGDIVGKAMDLIRSALPEGIKKTVGKVVIGTVQGDVHDLGKSLVGAYLRASLFEVHDLGTDVPAKTFVDKAEEYKADIVALSALMSSTMSGQKEVIDLIRDLGKSEQFKVIIGGGPTTQNWADEIGADGWGKTAPEAVRLCKKVLGMDN